MGYNKLERNLIDIIKEEQAKLGFFREDIRLYYPLSSLNHFFLSSCCHNSIVYLLPFNHSFRLLYYCVNIIIYNIYPLWVLCKDNFSHLRHFNFKMNSIRIHYYTKNVYPSDNYPIIAACKIHTLLLIFFFLLFSCTRTIKVTVQNCLCYSVVPFQPAISLSLKA